MRESVLVSSYDFTFDACLWPRYHCNLNILLGKMRGGGGIIKWADVATLKTELEAQACPAAAARPPRLLAVVILSAGGHGSLA
jgi:hypothetical protein